MFINFICAQCENWYKMTKVSWFGNRRCKVRKRNCTDKSGWCNISSVTVSMEAAVRQIHEHFSFPYPFTAFPQWPRPEKLYMRMPRTTFLLTVGFCLDQLLQEMVKNLSHDFWPVEMDCKAQNNKEILLPVPQTAGHTFRWGENWGKRASGRVQSLSDESGIICIWSFVRCDQSKGFLHCFVSDVSAGRSIW